jgi:hypothetical protein
MINNSTNVNKTSNHVSLSQEVRGIFVIKAAVEMQNNLPFSRKWWNLNDQSSYFQSILKYNFRAPDNFQVQRVITPYF